MSRNRRRAVTLKILRVSKTDGLEIERPLRQGLSLLLLALALALLPLPGVAGLAFAAGAALLVLRWPWLIWLPVAVFVPFTSSLRFGVASLTDLLLATGVALWFLDGARQRKLILFWSPVSSLAAGFVAVLFVSLFFAVDLGEGASEVIKWLQLPVLLLVVPTMLTVQRSRWLAAALILGACVQAILGLYQFIFQVGPEHFVIFGRFMRASGAFDQPNPFGGFLGLALPVTFSLAIWSWGEAMRCKEQRWRQAAEALLYTVAVALIALGVLASWSRGAWLGAFAGTLVVAVLRSRRAALISAFTASLLAIWLMLGAFSPAMLPKPLTDRLADLPTYLGLTDVLAQPVTDENFAVVERLAHWVAAQRMWERSPWFGVGIGNYAAVYPEVRLPRWEDPLGHAHNIYLNMLAETGLLGLAVFLALWGAVVVWSWRCFRSTSPVDGSQRWRAAVAVGIFGLVTHLTVHNLVDNLFVRGILVYIGLWLAIVHVDSHSC